jgi:hypothetical protein
VLYAMCTGRSPFRASTTLGVLKRVCDDEHRPIREVNPEIPDWLSRIIDKLLAKDTANRYQTADEVAHLLGTHLSICQRSNGQSPEGHVALTRQTVAAIDDVGPAKRIRRHHGWSEIVGSLIVVLAGLFVITEVTAVTRFVDPFAQFVGLKKPKGLIFIHLTNPELRVLVNDHLSLPGTGVYGLSMRPAGYAVDVFKGHSKLSHEYFILKPSMMVELTVSNAGTLIYGYDGPIPAVMSDSRKNKTSFDWRLIGPDGRPIDSSSGWQWQPSPPKPAPRWTEEAR